MQCRSPKELPQSRMGRAFAPWGAARCRQQSPQVFFGSMASLVLNMRRANKKNKVIHYGTGLLRVTSSEGRAPSRSPPNRGICRVVVPSALVGTLFGVLNLPQVRRRARSHS